MRLFNSAMMPCPGTYKCKRITTQQFANMLTSAWPNVISSIGYMQNINIIYDLTGIDIPFNRDNSELQDGDEILVMRLKNRIKDPKTKKDINVSVNDFEFFHVTYLHL